MSSKLIQKVFFFCLFCVLLALAWLMNRQPDQSKFSSSSQIHRVVSVDPATTEILLALDIKESLVGVSDYCLPNPQLQLTRCGGMVNPNFERIVALKPDLVFVWGTNDRLKAKAISHGLHAQSIEVNSFQDLISATRKIGKIMNRGSQAERLIQKMLSRIEDVKRRSSHLPARKTLMLIGSDVDALRHMTAVGGPTFFTEMLTAAHGKNIFESSQKTYFGVTRESIIAAQPEVIFEMRMNAPLNDSIRQRILTKWASEPTLPAVKNGNLILTNDPSLIIPGPKMVDLAEWFLNHMEKVK